MRVLALGVLFAMACSAAVAQEKPRSEASIECSKQADAQGLHGQERQAYRSRCLATSRAAPVVQVPNNTASGYFERLRGICKAEVAKIRGPGVDDEMLYQKCYDRERAKPASDRPSDSAALPKPVPTNMSDLKQGTYVQSDVPCKDAPFGKRQFFDGSRISAGHTCPFLIKGTQGSQVQVTGKCDGSPDGSDELTITFTARSPTAYSIKSEYGAFNFRYCTEAALGSGTNAPAAPVSSSPTAVQTAVASTSSAEFEQFKSWAKGGTFQAKCDGVPFGDGFVGMEGTPIRGQVVKMNGSTRVDLNIRVFADPKKETGFLSYLYDDAMRFCRGAIEKGQVRTTLTGHFGITLRAYWDNSVYRFASMDAWTLDGKDWHFKEGFNRISRVAANLITEDGQREAVQREQFRQQQAQIAAQNAEVQRISDAKARIASELKIETFVSPTALSANPFVYKGRLSASSLRSII